MAATTAQTPPITFLAAPQQQHLLYLFLPLAKGTIKSGVSAVQDLQQAVTAEILKSASGGGPDLRAQTGVHFFFFYGQAAGSPQALPVPAFTNYTNENNAKDLLVVQAIYDADFAPYISAFVQQPTIAAGLNFIVGLVDETGIPGVDATGPLSAEFIRSNGGVVRNPDAFNCLLMRYNFADPTIAASTTPGPNQTKYIFGGTFPGLTVGKILQNYPNALDLWPAAPVKITFEESVQPECNA